MMRCKACHSEHLHYVGAGWIQCCRCLELHIVTYQAELVAMPVPQLPVENKKELNQYIQNEFYGGK